MDRLFERYLCSTTEPVRNAATTKPGDRHRLPRRGRLLRQFPLATQLRVRTPRICCNSFLTCSKSPGAHIQPLRSSQQCFRPNSTQRNLTLPVWRKRSFCCWLWLFA